MPLFKDTVALEACPAKTAESVSYAVTFAVLGWLVFSNFSGLGYANVENSSIVVAESGVSSESDSAVSSPTQSIDFLSSETSGPTQLSTNVHPSSLLPVEAESASYSPLADLAAWHSNLGQAQQPNNLQELREFSTANWSRQSPSLTLLAEPFTADPDLPLPIIDTDFLFHSDPDPELASMEENSSGTIHEIIVTGSEISRLTARPDSIRRPQLPRPYRAQQAQRSLVLPPRIQALRP